MPSCLYYKLTSAIKGSVAAWNSDSVRLIIMTKWNFIVHEDL
jgi:hypothetical protein